MDEVKFEFESLDLGRVKFNTEHSVDIKCLSGCDRIHYIDSSCYCTSAKYENGVLSVSIDIEKAVGNLKAGEEKTSPKYVHVYLDSNEPHYIPDPLTKKMILNNAKQRITVPINFLAYN